MAKYSADVDTRFITLNGTEFMVKRLTWGEGSTAFDEYTVYQPATSFFTDQFSTYTHSDDGRFWGRTDSFFPDEKFAQYRGWEGNYWPEERIKHCTIYRMFQKAYTQEIARLAYGLTGDVRLG